MRLLSYRRGDGDVEIGALLDETRAADLQAIHRARHGDASAHLTDMLAFLEGGLEARELVAGLVDAVTTEGIEEHVLSLEDVELLSPVPRPASIRDFMAFEDHIVNCIRAVGLGPLAFLDEGLERVLGRRFTLAHLANRAWHRRPLYYKGNRFSVVGHDAEVRVPPGETRMDFELEFGVFLSKSGRDIPANRAREHIGGYVIFDDFSARDAQLDEQAGRLGPAKGKDFDTGNAMGPWLVTPDEVPDAYALEMCARVNGEEWSRGSSADMGWSFEEMIEYVSRGETLHPGEFFGSGTCSGPRGSGCGLEQGRFLSPGDVVELEVEGLGLLRNRLVRPPAPAAQG